jgi:hypothetical protein
MKNQLFTGALALSLLSAAIAAPSQAASLGSCSSNIGPLVSIGGVGQSGFVGADSCQKSLDTNDSEANVESIFGGIWIRAFKTNANNTSADEVFTQGNLALTYIGGAPSQDGTWSISGLTASVNSVILAVKAGAGNNASAQSLIYYKFDDLSVLSGGWSTFGLVNNGGNQPDLSHMTVYTSTSGNAIPTPALLPGLLGLGAAVWRKRKGEAVTAAA